MSLVRELDEVRPDVIALECPHCGARYGRADWSDLDEPLSCLYCDQVGLVPRRPRVADRFPGDIGTRFTPMPEALMDHAEALKLGSRELLVLWALERHRRSAGDLVFPSIERLALLTRLSERTVKRSIQQLVDLGHVTRHQARRTRSARMASNRYDLSSLWDSVATRAASDPAGQSGPPPRGQIVRLPRARTAREVDPSKPHPFHEASRLAADALAPVEAFRHTTETT